MTGFAHSPAAANSNGLLQLSASTTQPLLLFRCLVTAMAPVEIATIAENAHGSAFEVGLPGTTWWLSIAK